MKLCRDILLGSYNQKPTPSVDEVRLLLHVDRTPEQLEEVAEELAELITAAPTLNFKLLHQPTTCSHVVRINWPPDSQGETRGCVQQALYACQNPGCEAALCCVHIEECDQCGAKLCAGCCSLHHGRVHG
jgi:hypothetical protein